MDIAQRFDVQEPYAGLSPCEAVKRDSRVTPRVTRLVTCAILSCAIVSMVSVDAYVRSAPVPRTCLRFDLPGTKRRRAGFHRALWSILCWGSGKAVEGLVRQELEKGTVSF